MRLRFICLVLLTVISLQSITGQKKSRKDRKRDRYELQKKSLRDTTFFFITNKILYPFTSNDWSGGYLNINGSKLRVQELDWLESPNSRIRWREITSLNNYSIERNKAEESSTVSFDCMLKGQPYFFTITHGWEKPAELTIRNSQGKEVRYSGKVKK